MHICNVRSQVFFPGVWVCLRDFILFFYFFGSLEREPSLWENTWPWEILRTWESFPGTRVGNKDLWGGEKESTFDTGRRVETGTYEYHWEGRKPFIQTFEYMKYQLIQWISYLSRHFWAKNFGTRIPRPPIKTNGATESKQSKIELRMNTPKTAHLISQELWSFIWSKM